VTPLLVAAVNATATSADADLLRGLGATGSSDTPKPGTPLMPASHSTPPGGGLGRGAAPPGKQANVSGRGISAD
jgi:hypothetical protein